MVLVVTAVTLASFPVGNVAVPLVHAQAGADLLSTGVVIRGVTMFRRVKQQDIDTLVFYVNVPRPDGGTSASSSIGPWETTGGDSADSADPGSDSTSSPTPARARLPLHPIELPIEVLGPDGYIAERIVHLDDDDPIDVDRIFIQCHRCGYRDSSVNLARGPKGQLSLNGGPWVDMDDETAAVFEPEKSYGGIAGGYPTTRFYLPVGGAVAGENKLQFRFTGTDGISEGYRVLAFALEATGRPEGQRRVSRDADQVEDDPALWQPPLAAAASIAQGKSLWTATNTLVKSPLSSVTMRASCSGCHAVDGRDLKYFNYSNRAIRVRSQFHGMTEDEGDKIASYIRSLDLKLPAGDIVAEARPWNPPYQPGPGLDGKPVEHWAAGAGLDAVLDEDTDMVTHLLANDTSHAAIAAVADPNGTLNVRELPVSLQFPDWNAWLPLSHPDDAWGDAFRDTPVFYNESVHGTYLRIRNRLEQEGRDALLGRGELDVLMTELGNQTTNLSGVMDTAILADGAHVGRDGVYPSVMHWGAVKTWELMHSHGLEDLAPEVYGAPGEPRSWLGWRREVFELAPHRTAESKTNYPYQSLLVGRYFSTAWYQLQLTLNAGNRNAAGLWPIDWNYQLNHIVDILNTGGPSHPWRYFTSYVKMIQQYSDGKPVGQSALGLGQVHPRRFAPGQGHGLVIDALPQDQRVDVYEALLHATVATLEAHDPAEWTRGPSPEGSDNDPGPIDTIPELIDAAQLDGVCHRGNFATCWFSMVPLFRAAGVGDPTLNRLIAWGKLM